MWLASGGPRGPAWTGWRIVRGLLAGLIAGGAAAALQAADDAILRGAFEKVSSDAVTISGFESSLALTESGIRGEFRIARIEFTDGGQAFDDIRVSCPALVLTNRRVRCANATIGVTLPVLGRRDTPGAFHYDRAGGTAELELSDLAIAGGRIRLRLAAGAGGLEARYTATALQLGEVLELARRLGQPLTGFSAAGHADVTGTLSAPAGKPLRVALAARVGAMAVANSAGTIATDGVAGTLDVELTAGAGSTAWSIRLDGVRGEAYLEPVYANFSEHPVRLFAEDVVTRDYTTFEVGHFRLRQDSLLDAEGRGTLVMPKSEDDAAVVTADVTINEASVTNLYTSLVSVVAAGTLFGELETSGRLSGSIRIADSALRSATLRLADVILDDRRGRFAIYALQGELDWSAGADRVPAPSQLSWGSGTVYNLLIGGGDARFQLGGRDVELLAPLRLPALGGALRINEFALSGFGSDGATGRLDAELEPIQLGQLTGSFGWPAFSGTLSGRLPLLTLRENTVSVGGTLSARAFDGTMEMSNLRIDQPFGRVPRLSGDVALRDLDLERVTEAFSFGLIQGRLSGDVSGLQMQAWRPVAMDMRFYTPPDDSSRHRISQRAVENLASVGGGGAATALSGGFLRFFEVFAYDRIGLRCVLRNGVCSMSGVGPAKSGPQGAGYYIVKGSGIPRIDVVGYRDTVSWSRLVRQLSAITRSGSPTVN